MRAYRVSVTTSGTKEDVEHVMFAGTQGDAKAVRRSFVNDYGVKIDEVSIEEVEIATSKNELITFINQLIAQ